jgi:diguanylate cyclase (GGDEF)-like protein
VKVNTMIGEVAPLSARSHAVLTVLTGTQTGRVILLKPGAPISIGRSEGCAVRFDDASVSGRHAQVVCIAEKYHLLDEGSTNGSAVNGQRMEKGRAVILGDGDRVQLGSATLMRFSLVDDAEREALTRMYEAAFRDALTGAYNRKHLDERLDAELAFALRHGTELSVVIFDVDHFKSVNDSHGHLAGDAILKTCANVVARQLRQEDLLARYGGEEFMIVARGIPLASAIVLGDRLRVAVASSSTTVSGVDLRVTVSAGVASLRCCGKPKDKASLISLADARLYRAKEAGRNRVVGA